MSRLSTCTAQVSPLSRFALVVCATLQLLTCTRSDGLGARRVRHHVCQASPSSFQMEVSRNRYAPPLGPNPCRYIRAVQYLLQLTLNCVHIHFHSHLDTAENNASPLVLMVYWVAYDYVLSGTRSSTAMLSLGVNNLWTLWRAISALKSYGAWVKSSSVNGSSKL